MNNFAQLADGAGATFLVRWRGRQEGPYAASVIEAKLEANEIGLLHEIFYGGKWITIRDYVTEREAVLRAARQAQEEQERRTREEAEREREERRRAQLLAEEEQKGAQRQAELSRQIHGHQPTFNVPRDKKDSPGLRVLGAILLIAGLGATGYFFLVFDPSVESGAGRVNNLGLMADRQNGIIIGIGLAVVSIIILAMGSRGRD